MMPTERPVKETVQNEIRKIKAEAEQRALRGESIDALLNRVDSLKRLLDLELQPKDRTWIWAAGVAAICLTVTTGSAALKVPHTRVQINIETESLSFILGGAIRWDGTWPVDSKLVRFQNIEYPELPDFPKPPWIGRASFDVEATNGSTNIRRLTAQSGAAIFVDWAGESLVLAVSGAPSSVELNAKGSVKVAGHDNHGAEWKPDAVDFDEVPADFGSNGMGSSVVPASMQIHPLSSIVLRGIPITEISFLQEELDAQQKPIAVSRIKSGSITLTDVASKFSLSTGDMLHLEDARGVVSVLEIGASVIKLRFEGNVSGIVTGQGDFQHDWRPSVLDFLFHQQRIGFVWGAITALWGLLWSVRKLLFPGGSLSFGAKSSE
jgi:hypothetical protein